jgi:hypothetical protein
VFPRTRFKPGLDLEAPAVPHQGLVVVFLQSAAFRFVLVFIVWFPFTQDIRKRRVKRLTGRKDSPVSNGGSQEQNRGHAFGLGQPQQPVADAGQTGQ